MGMGTFGVKGDMDVGCQPHDKEGRKTGNPTNNGWRPFGMEDFKLEYLKRMNMEDVVEFSRMRTRVLTDSTYSWAKAATDFKVSERSLSRDASLFLVLSRLRLPDMSFFLLISLPDSWI